MNDFEVHPPGTLERIERLERELQRLRAQRSAERAGRRSHIGHAAARSGDAAPADDPLADSST